MAIEPQENPTDLERDLGRRKPNPRHGHPWIGAGIDRKGDATAAYPGTGTSIPQDIGADGFEVEPLPDEPRDNLDDIDTNLEEETPEDDLDYDDRQMTPSVDGFSAAQSSVRTDRASRVDRLDNEETFHDEEETDQMGHSGELGELPPGSQNISAGELGRYECPNCGFEYDVVVGTAARCPRCQYEAHLSNVVGDEAFHDTFSATDLDD